MRVQIYYHPVINEIVLVKHHDEWLRSVEFSISYLSDLKNRNNITLAEHKCFLGLYSFIEAGFVYIGEL